LGPAHHSQFATDFRREMNLAVALHTALALVSADPPPPAPPSPELEGVYADRIVVGMSTALTGPSQGLGLEMKRGVEAYFAELNPEGGVLGRKLELVALDDGYEPGRAGPNMHELIEKRHVFGILGNVGTPTAIVSLPIALEAKVPFFGAFTGAGLLRKNPPDR